MDKLYFVDLKGLDYFNAKIHARCMEKSTVDHTHYSLLDNNLSEFILTIKDSDTIGIVAGKLLKGKKTITLDTGVSIGDTNSIFIYTSMYGLSPDEVEHNGSLVTATFAKQENDIDIIIAIK